MFYLKKYSSLGLLLIVSVSCYAGSDNNIYTWRSENGTVVFSQASPMFEEEYERVGVRPINEINANSPVEQQLASLKQSNLYIKDQEIQQPDPSESYNREVVKVKVISPARGQNYFVNNEKLTVVLEPTLEAEDHPVFVVNGVPHPAHFQNGVWMISRPNPGPVVIAVRGRTKDNKIINSSDSEFNMRRVFGKN